MKPERSGFSCSTTMPPCGASSQGEFGGLGPSLLPFPPPRDGAGRALPPAKPWPPAGRSVPNTMSRVCVSVEPSGFWAVQRYMEPLSSAGTRSSTSSFPSNSVLPSRRRLPTRVHVNMGSGKTSFCWPEQGRVGSQAEPLCLSEKGAEAWPGRGWQRILL